MTAEIIVTKTLNRSRTVGNKAVTAGTEYMVTIYTKRIEIIKNKTLISIQIPVGYQSWKDKDPQTRIIDFKRVTGNLINVQGVIKDSLTTSADYKEGGTAITETAPNIRSVLIAMIEDGGIMTVNYEGNDYSANVDKVSIIETATDETIATHFDITINFVIGINWGA